MSLFERAGFKWFGLWWLIGWVWVALVWYLSLTSNPVELDLGTTFNDKIGHALAYAGLMFWFGNLYQCRHARTVYAVIFILMGVLLEIIQGSMTDVRQFSYGDMLANAIGVGLGYLLVLGFWGRVLQKFEQLFINAKDIKSQAVGGKSHRDESS
jgi:VanZ family protein